MPTALPKRLARRVMALALLIAPAGSSEWAAAMSAEMEHINGTWQTLSWALGCFGTVFKQLCFSVFSPGTFFDAREAAMSKFAKVSAVVLVLGSALFLLAPQFRQALRVTAASWHQSDSVWLSQMRILAAKAEAAHDAQTLAFVAMQMAYDSKSRAERDKFADEAVNWDPRLTWIYSRVLSVDAMTARRNPDPNDARWMNRLQAWDPGNVEVYALKASFTRPAHTFSWNFQSNRAALANSTEWTSDMDRVFSSSSYDSYAARQATLERAVTAQHRLEDPRNMSLDSYLLPDLGNFHAYAEYFLLPAAADFQAKGDLTHAEQTYEKIAHLGELMQIGAYTDIERLVGIGLQRSADSPLEAIFEKNGNSTAAKLVAFQIASGQQASDLIGASHSDLEASLGRVDALVLQLSLGGIALSLLLIILSCACLIGRRLFISGKASRWTALFARTGIAGAALLFASVIVMYFDYAPYAAAFQSYMRASNPRDAYASLLRFEVLYELPNGFFYSFQQIYLWYTVIAVGGAVIAWILYRHVSRTFRHSAPVQPAA